MAKKLWCLARQRTEIISGATDMKLSGVAFFKLVNPPKIKSREEVAKKGLSRQRIEEMI